jgi:tetratricopeptide (TPR) repeat protein
MRCLEKDRSRRYETANGLAMDIERHLNNEPVTARPPSTVYLFTKLVRRHRLAFAAGLGITLALAAGFAASTLLYLRERDSLDRARRAEKGRESALRTAVEQKNAADQARKEAEQGKKTVQEQSVRHTKLAVMMLANLKDIGLNAGFAPDQRVLREMMAKAAALQKEFADQPEFLAAVDETLGGVYVKMDELKRAEEMFQEALKVRRQAQGEKSPEVAQTLNYLGHVYSRQSRWEEAYQTHEDALQLLQDLQAEHPARKDPEISRTMSAMGWVRAQQGELSEAANFLQLALEAQRKAGAMTDVATTLIRIGSVLTHDGRVAEAEEMLREALSINRDIFGANSLQVISSLQALAVTIALNQVRLPEAIALYRDAFEIRERINNPNAVHDSSLVEKKEPPPTVQELLIKPGALAEVEAALRDAQQYAVSRYGRDSWEQAFYHALRAWVLLQEKRYVEAERAVRDCLSIRENLRAEDWSTHHARHMLGAALAGQGRAAEAEHLLLLGYSGMKERRTGIPLFHKPRLGEAALRVKLFFADLGQVDRVTEWTAEFNSLDAEERKVLMPPPAK